MSRFNNGLIFTDDNCIACNRCINLCSINGANVSIVKNGKCHIEVDGQKCNDCGKCISQCTNHSRTYSDDSARFFADLEKGKNISVILSSSIHILYGDSIKNFIGLLREKGVKKVYDSSYGSEIYTWLVTKYLKDNYDKPTRDKAFISNACSSLVRVIEKYYPFLIRKLIPVQSPVMCTAIYVHKYLKDDNKIAFIGPCISKKDEIDNLNTMGNIDYNITFENFINHYKKEDVSGYSGEFDLNPDGLGKIFLTKDSSKEIISHFFSRKENIISMVGFTQDNFDKLSVSCNDNDDAHQPLFAEIMACKAGCVSGPGAGTPVQDKNKIYSNIYSAKSVLSKYDKITDPDEFWEIFSKMFSSLNSEDFHRDYENESKQKSVIPQIVLEDIFNEMYKDTPEKRNLNCGSCGNKSCRQMAESIAYGFSCKENCIHYMNDLMLKNFVYDKETEIYTRPAFLKECEKLINENPEKKYFLCVGDINKFKIINDLYSFETGNKVLKSVCNDLKSIVGNKGLIGRIGGGTFGLCMENNIENLQKIQEKKLFENNFLGVKITVSMRFGLIFIDSKSEIIYALNCASMCMDRNVSEMKNTFTFYSEEMQKNTYLEADITSKMQEALDNEEFKIWFQPQYSTTTGALVGAEALCRWIKSDGSIVSPGVFIPIAEKNGFIKILDKEIWKNVFALIRKWIDEGIEPVPISINVSRVSLESDAILYVIKRLQTEYNVPEKYIHFEITESAYMDNQKELINRLKEIKKMGFVLAMDDFGSGYSSLNALKDMPIDILKLDMGFVRGQNNMERGGAILTCITRMAIKLDLITIAEGVETQELADFLHSIGVNTIQGYLYAKPMQESDFRNIILGPRKIQKTTSKRVSGKLDIKKFFDPDSSENYMFNEILGPVAIYEYDHTTNVISLVRMNEKALNVLGMDKLPLSEVKSILKKIVTKKITLDSIELFKKQITERNEAEEVFVIVNQSTHKEMAIKVTIMLMERFEQKDTLLVLVKNVEDSEKNNSLMKFMIDNSPAGMSLMRVDTSKKVEDENMMEIIKVNKAFYNMFGYDQKDVNEFFFQKAMDYLVPEDRERFILFNKKNFENGFKETSSIIYKAKRKNGEYFNVQLTVYGIKQADDSFLVISTYLQIE